MFYITERFFSLQGEGRYAGVPSYFLRTGGCNMRCEGFGTEYGVSGEKRRGCDSWFAVDKDFKDKWIGIDDANGLIESIKAEFNKIGYIPHLVITGGEPLVYHKDRVFYEMVSTFVEMDINITFETNGTIEVDFLNFPAYQKCIFAISVKLENSMELKSKRVNSSALKSFSAYAKEYFLKFTISDELIKRGRAIEEIEEIRSILPEAEIFCMPLGEDRKTIKMNDKAVFDFCMKNNFRYSDRLHIRVFDKKRGV